VKPYIFPLQTNFLEFNPATKAMVVFFILVSLAIFKNPIEDSKLKKRPPGNSYPIEEDAPKSKRFK
jgi:hypothetical protein